MRKFLWRISSRFTSISSSTSQHNISSSELLSDSVACSRCMAGGVHWVIAAHASLVDVRCPISGLRVSAGHLGRVWLPVNTIWSLLAKLATRDGICRGGAERFKGKVGKGGIPHKVGACAIECWLWLTGMPTLPGILDGNCSHCVCGDEDAEANDYGSGDIGGGGRYRIHGWFAGRAACFVHLASLHKMHRGPHDHYVQLWLLVRVTDSCSASMKRRSGWDWGGNAKERMQSRGC